jgi:CheY-like chemotaxis protein
MIRVLLVDDDEIFRPMVQLMLERLGHEVVTAANGTEALARYAEQRCDIVLTDIVMPDKEGLETIRALTRGDRGVRIIAMSGGGRVNANDYLHLAAQFGAARVLRKPFSMQELVEALDALQVANGSASVPAART